MSVLVLMYHRARPGRHGNAPEMLDDHFQYVAQRCDAVLPGESGRRDRLNICLTFDDAFFDFHAIVLPLLRKYGLRTVLAVPTSCILEQTSATRAERLAIGTDEAFARPDRGGFCTWPELAEIAASGHIAFAAHGHRHTRLDLPGVNLVDEVDTPAILLRSRLGITVDSFVFPFGRFDARALQYVRSRYRYAFRIGGAVSSGWSHSRLLYRVDADEMTAPDALFTPARHLLYRARWTWNRLRGR